MWADWESGVVGVFFAQMMDIPLMAGLHTQFRDAVTEAFRMK